MLYRAGGGMPGVRVVPVAAATKPRSAPLAAAHRRQRQRAAQSRLDAETLALPPRLAVFPERELNRDPISGWRRWA